MNLSRKKPRPLTRQEGHFRDARLFVIATEDTHAPKQYFDGFQNSRIKLRVLPTEEGRSSPEHILERLDEFRDEFQVMEDDEFWLMLDTDHWVRSNHVQNFTRVCAEALGKGYRLAHSNPCFEVWLLLHVTDLDGSEQLQNGADVERRLREILGEYNKCNLNPDHFSLDQAVVAVERAERLDTPPDDRWPSRTGSHVYRLMRSLRPS